MVIAKIKHDCKTELNNVDLWATPARLALMNLLEASKELINVQSMIDYPDAKDISADSATVFRIVNMFTQKGLTKQIRLQEGKFRYELTSKADHHHLVCICCGGIQDMSDCNIEFFGICANCQQ